MQAYLWVSCWYWWQSVRLHMAECNCGASPVGKGTGWFRWCPFSEPRRRRVNVLLWAASSWGGISPSVESGGSVACSWWWDSGDNGTVTEAVPKVTYKIDEASTRVINMWHLNRVIVRSNFCSYLKCITVARGLEKPANAILQSPEDRIDNRESPRAGRNPRVLWLHV